MIALVVALIIAGSVPASASTGWVMVPSANPAAAAQSFLEGVACSGASCFAVGSYISTKGALRTLIERSTGKHWTIVASPNHPGLVSTLWGVACAGPRACFAVGNSRSSTRSHALALIERWDGKKWSIVASPGAPNATGSYLHAVTCARATDCEAVGYYTSATTDGSTLIEHWNGHRWSVVPSPDAHKAALDSLTSVSCPVRKPTSCMAVGSWSPTADGAPFYTLTERWDGRHWSIVPSPNVNKTQNSALNAVSCPSATRCMAVGSWQHQPGATLAERWNGSAWKIVTTPNPTGFTFAQLNGISCTSGASCFAVGASSKNLLGDNMTLVQHWNGTKWRNAPSPNPAGPSNNLLAVSCAPGSGCSAVGTRLQLTFANPSAPLAVRHS